MNLAESVLIKQFQVLVQMRRRYIELKAEQVRLEKAGIALFEKIKKGLSAKAKPKTRRAARKLKSEPAGI